MIDGARVHGSPNHCGLGNYGNTIIRNAVMYNCQDYQWSIDVANLTMEHVVLAGDGLPLEAVNRALGPVTMRNSIMQGKITWVRGWQSRCTWEAGSLFENMVMQSTASVERCADQKTYPLAVYIANCSGDEPKFLDCATFRNITLVEPSQWGTVLKGGMWSAQHGDQWDVTLVPGSPAIDIGESGTPTDIEGRPRPQGALADAGVSKPARARCSFADREDASDRRAHAHDAANRAASARGHGRTAQAVAGESAEPHRQHWRERIVL